MSSRRAGFTLLEVMVATLIMGIAVVGLIVGLTQSVKNASRLGDNDRAAMLARTRMNELLADAAMPIEGLASGDFDPSVTNRVPSGWRAQWRPFDVPPLAGPGTAILDRIELQVWWEPAGGTRRTLQLEAYKRTVIPIPPPGAGS